MRAKPFFQYAVLSFEISMFPFLAVFKLTIIILVIEIKEEIII